MKHPFSALTVLVACQEMLLLGVLVYTVHQRHLRWCAI